MTVFSDHGMTPIRWTYDLARDVDALGLRTPGDYLAAYDSTMARFWVSDARAADRLTALLAPHPCGRLLERDELSRLGVWFDDDRYYQILFLARPGVLISPSHMGSVRFAGMHGYHPSEPTADAALLASRPVDPAVSHIAHVHDLVLEDAGVRPPRVAANGHASRGPQGFAPGPALDQAGAVTVAA